MIFSFAFFYRLRAGCKGKDQCNALSPPRVFLPSFSGSLRPFRILLLQYFGISATRTIQELPFQNPRSSQHGNVGMIFFFFGL